MAVWGGFRWVPDNDNWRRRVRRVHSMLRYNRTRASSHDQPHCCNAVPSVHISDVCGVADMCRPENEPLHV